MGDFPSIKHVPQTAHASKPFRFFLIAGAAILAFALFVLLFSKKSPGAASGSTNPTGDVLFTENVYNPPGNSAGGVPTPMPPTTGGTTSGGSSGGSHSGGSGSSGGSHSGGSGTPGSSGGSHSGGSHGKPVIHPKPKPKPPVHPVSHSHPIHHPHTSTRMNPYNQPPNAVANHLAVNRARLDRLEAGGDYGTSSGGENWFTAVGRALRSGTLVP